MRTTPKPVNKVAAKLVEGGQSVEPPTSGTVFIEHAPSQSHPKQPSPMDLLAMIHPDHQSLMTGFFQSVEDRYPSLEQIWGVLGPSICTYFRKTRASWIESFPPHERERVIANRLKTHVVFCQGELYASLIFAEKIDRWEAKVPSFTKLFLGSLLDKGAGPALLDHTSFQQRGDHMKSVDIANGEDSFRAMHSRRITDGLRKTGSLSTVLSTFSGEIGHFAKQGDERFFLSLETAIRAYRLGKLVLSFEQWLRDVWLPLALWQASPDEAVERLERYRALCIANGERVPRSQTPASIKDSVRRFRNRLKQRRAD